MKHLIEKIVFETTCSNQKNGKQIQHEAGPLLQNQFAHILEPLLDKYAPHDAVWTINNITINLPALDVKTWREDVIRLAVQQVEDFLIRNAPDLINGQYNDDSYIAPEILAGNLILYYIETGIVKQNPLFNSLTEIEAAFTQKSCDSINQRVLEAFTLNEIRQARFILNTGNKIKTLFFSNISFFNDSRSLLNIEFNKATNIFVSAKKQEAFIEMLLLNFYLVEQTQGYKPHNTMHNLTIKYLINNNTILLDIISGIRRSLAQIISSNVNTVLELWEEKIQQAVTRVSESPGGNTENDKTSDSITTNNSLNISKSESHGSNKDNIIGKPDAFIKSEEATKFESQAAETDAKEILKENRTLDITVDKNVEITPTEAQLVTEAGVTNTLLESTTKNDITDNGVQNDIKNKLFDTDEHIIENSFNPEKQTKITDLQHNDVAANTPNAAPKSKEKKKVSALEHNDDETKIAAENSKKNRATEEEEKEEEAIERMKPVDAPVLPQHLYIKNAGLVILTPFISRLFENTGLLAGKEWRSVLHHQKAVLLTQYLVTGETIYYENELVLNKLVCGYPITDVVDTGIEITREDLAQCRELLEAVIQHWEILKNTSPEGLQETFLIRDAKLAFKEKAPELWVEQKGVDILLSKLPWGIALVKTPWMDGFLHCNWA